MIVLALKVKLYAPFVHSLKEKRMVVLSIVQKLKNKFNISISEVESMDIHQTIVIGISAVSNNIKLLYSIGDKIVNFIEDNCEAIIEEIEKEIY